MSEVRKKSLYAHFKELEARIIELSIRNPNWEVKKLKIINEIQKDLIKFSKKHVRNNAYYEEEGGLM
jgi:hypothetical protein